jgi:IMP dehydrogenase
MKNELEKIFYGATFDDFLLRPQHSRVKTRKAVDLTMPLTRNIRIAIPFVGANMDTVMGQEMMKALSLEGAFGFLARNKSIKESVEEVRHVKRQHSFVIEDPLILHKGVTMAEAKKIAGDKNSSSVLIEDASGSRILAGILSHRDMPPLNQHDKLVTSFMTPFNKMVTAKPGISMEQAELLMFKNRIEKLPLINARRKIKGLITMRDIKLSKQKPYSSKDRKGRLLVGVSIGATGDYLERAEALIDAGADVILMDVAHAHSEVIAQAIKSFKKKFKDFNLVVGNVGTSEAAKFLVDLGADAVKVGIGPGKGCRTRLETGAGVPQMQAIREVYLAVGDKIPIIADGGTKNDKDIFLAIAAGASTVMSGSIFSGATEAPGIVVEDPVTRQKVKLYRGMTSPEAVVEGATGEIEEVLSTPSEGQSVKVPVVGSVADILQRVKGHLQSSVSYAGEDNLQKVHLKVAKDPGKYLIRLSEASRKESFDR